MTNAATPRFRRLATITALLFFLLSASWMFIPDQMLSAWGVIYSTGAGLMSRRVAAMCAGIGTMFWLARYVGLSPARSALIKGFSVACLLLAFLGIFELTVNHVSPGILISVGIEITLPLVFLYVAGADARQSRIKKL